MHRHAMSCSIGLLLGLATFSGCESKTETSSADPPDIAELVVLTPHAEPVRAAFAERFSLWHERTHGGLVTIRWIQKGTVDAQRYLYDQYTRSEAPPAQIDIDVFFGGGLAVHRDVIARGYAQAIKVPGEVLNAIPKDLNGQPLYAPDGSWYGSALGGYGIIYNRRACAARDLPVPATWADLAKPAYQGWIAAGDPGLSGSTTECLVMVLLKHGWEQGWGILTGILANCSGLCPSSGQVAPNVAAGISVAGLQAEFVARMTVASAPDVLEYVSPPPVTALIPDPVTVLQGAPHPRAAAAFVEFVLSPEGQGLWALPAELGGPSGEPLYRYPIRPDIYERYHGKLLVKGNPFAEKPEFTMDAATEAAYTQLLPRLLRAMCGRPAGANSNHLLLQKAWKAAWARGEASPHLASLREPPFSRADALKYASECAANAKRAAELEAQWSAMFRKRCESVLGTATRPNATADAHLAR